MSYRLYTGRFPKIRGTFTRGPHNKDYNMLGYILGSRYFGKLPLRLGLDLQQHIQGYKGTIKEYATTLVQGSGPIQVYRKLRPC